MTTALEKATVFDIIANQNLAILVFADDIIQLANTPERLQFLLNLTSYHLDAISLKISIPKSAVFHIRHLNKTWITEPLQAKLQGQHIRNYAVVEKFDYLGASYTIFERLSNGEQLKQISAAALKCQKLALKPYTEGNSHLPVHYSKIPASFLD